MSVEQKILQALVENSSTKSLSKIFYWYTILPTLFIIIDLRVSI